MIGDGSILRAAIGGALQGVAGQFGIRPSSLPALTNAVAAQMAKDPAVANQMSTEHPAKSRVVVGSTLALIGGGFLGAAQLVAMFKTGTIDVELAGGALAAILGAAFSLYGRLRTGLVPLFTRRKA